MKIEEMIKQLQDLKKQDSELFEVVYVNENCEYEDDFELRIGEYNTIEIVRQCQMVSPKEYEALRQEAIESLKKNYNKTEIAK